MMNSADDEISIWMCLLVTLAFGAGIVIPIKFLGISFFQFSEREEGLFALSFLAFICLIYRLSNKIGKNHPNLREWATNSLPGVCVLTFVFTLSASFFACLISIFPLPWWLKFAGVGCLYLYAGAIAE